jgi:hypothetical protein
MWHTNIMWLTNVAQQYTVAYKYVAQQYTVVHGEKYGFHNTSNDVLDLFFPLKD